MEEILILDVLPSGAPFSLSPGIDSFLKKKGVRVVRGGYLTMPIAFGISKDKLSLVLLVLAPNSELKPGESVDLSEGKNILAWARVGYNEISAASRSELETAVEKIIEEKDEKFADFFNKAPPITTRLHSLELIPGIGKKHMWDIIDSRRKPFKSLNEIKERLPMVPDPKKGIKERILKELQGGEKYYLFVLPPRR